MRRIRADKLIKQGFVDVMRDALSTVVFGEKPSRRRCQISSKRLVVQHYPFPDKEVSHAENHAYLVQFEKRLDDRTRLGDLLMDKESELGALFERHSQWRVRRAKPIHIPTWKARLEKEREAAAHALA